MINILIRQMPEELHAKIKARAQANRRSMNQEVLILLQRSLTGAPFSRSAIPSPLEGTFPVDDGWLDQARQEGRA